MASVMRLKDGENPRTPGFNVYIPAGQDVERESVDRRRYSQDQTFMDTT